ncbi:MAG TPA: response regulator [Candidatus Sumerlaeota bacterium]|nr:response regulator [Candidatus Sumerlaeota bacterium]
MKNEKRILIIDDEERMCNSLRHLLSVRGYVVDTALTGAEGIERLSTRPYHVAVTDLRLNDMDGVDIMRYIRQNTPETLIIIITGHASTESAIEAIHCEAFDYFTKPFDFDLFRSSIEKAFLKIEAEQIREEMIYMITHDIKLPLTSIIGYSSLLMERETGVMSPRAPEYSAAIYLNSQKLMSLVDNFLTTCKIKAGRFSICETQVCLNPIIEDLRPIIRMSAEKRDIVMDMDLAQDIPPLSLDENLMFRAIGNLVNNAIKYTPEGGHIHIRTRLVPPVSSPLCQPSALVAITNTGPGIPADEIPGIFDRYERSSRVCGIEGSGIGLFVVKSVVNAHGGIVHVESIPDEKTTFSVYLPVRNSG